MELTLLRDLEWIEPRSLTHALPVAAFLVLLSLVFGRRRRGALVGSVHAALRLALLAALAFLSATPSRTKLHREEGHVFVALDLSASVDAAERQSWLLKWGESATGDKAPNLSFLTFGDRLRAVPADRDLRFVAPGESTRLGPAIAAIALHPHARPGSRVHIWTDGRTDDAPIAGLGPDLEPRIHPARTVPPLDLRVDRVLASAGPALSEPWSLRVLGHAPQELTVELQIWVDGARASAVPVHLPAGAFSLPTAVPLNRGMHLVTAVVAAPTDPDWNNRATVEVRVRPPTRVTVVGGAPDSLLVRALKAQAVETRHQSLEALMSDLGGLEQPSVLVLDRVPMSELSTPGILASLTECVESGLGMLVLPNESPGEFFDAQQKPFLDLLGLIGLEPPPPAPPKKPAPTPPEAAPDVVNPEARKKEMREVPSLGLLLLIDGSSSMRGETLRLAKEAAVAAVEVLHPEDFVGVVAFNQEARVLVELTRANDIPAIRDRIARIQARGGTDFVAPLEAAREMFGLADLAVRHAILLTDGHPNEMRPLEAMVEGLAAAGITLSTVGCGTAYNETLLSNLALWGRGKFHPAPDPSDVPQIFTIEAERVIAGSGARKREAKGPERAPSLDVRKPEPTPPALTEASDPVERKLEALRIRDAAPYLEGLPWSSLPGVEGRHPARARSDAWVALETEGGAPVLVHGWVGRGRIVTLALPIEGSFGPSLARWEGVGPWLAQVIRFLERGVPDRQLAVRTELVGRAVISEVADAQSRDPDPDSYRYRWADVLGNEVHPSGEEREGGLRRRFHFAPEIQGGLTLTVSRGSPDLEDQTHAAVVLPPPPERLELGPDLVGLEGWARALGGRLAPETEVDGSAPGRRAAVTEPLPTDWIPWLIALVLADLGCQRAWPGRRRMRGEVR